MKSPEQQIPSYGRLDGFHNVLLLQGPMGPFMRRFADFLLSYQKRVFKINLNGGDAFFYRGTDTFNFSGRPEEWINYLQDFLAKHKIDQIYLFGDCRFYHEEAITLARTLGVNVSVFEEGYIRPHYITLEPWGVNHHSALPRTAAFYLSQNIADPIKPGPTGLKFASVIKYGMAYYAGGFLLRWRFPHYQHHKNFSPFAGLAWWRSLYRKHRYRLKEQNLLPKLVNDYHKKFFLVPLQVFNDSQVLNHYELCSVDTFIDYVMRSFAESAPKDVLLVIKHHPMDRGQTDYSKFIQRLAFELGLEGRAHYIHDLHLPTLLDAACGTVVINSTVGLSSLLHDTPVKAVGNCLYDFEGLTNQSHLDEFWSQPGEVNKPIYKAFRNYLIDQTQINGCFQAEISLAEFERFSLRKNVDTPDVSLSADKTLPCNIDSEGAIVDS